MASLIDWLFMSGARDVAGEPIATGAAYFYVPGSTSEAITVYSDSAGTSPLSQPITLDAAGRAEVYANAQCEIVIKNSLGVIQRLTSNGKSLEAVQVNVTWGGTTAPLSTALAAIEPAISYKESSTATTRTLHDAIQRVITPQDFGAVGNGVVDDTTALQAAINRALAVNLPVDLGSGTYKVTAGLTANGPLRMFGASRATTIIASSSAFDILTVAPTPDAGFILENFSVLGPYGTSNAAIKINDGRHGRIVGVGARGVFGIEAFAARNTHIESCYVQVKGNVSTSSIGIKVGPASFVGSCKVDCNPDSTSVQYSTGISLAGDGGVAVRCDVYSADYGYRLSVPDNQRNLAIASSATSCVHSFGVNGPKTGAIGCASVAASSVAYDNGTPGSFIDIANTWTTDPTDSHINDLIDAKLNTYDATVNALIGAQVSGWSYAESSGVTASVGTVSDIFRLSVPGTPMTNYVGMKTLCFALSDVGTALGYVAVTLSGSCVMPNKMNVVVSPMGDWTQCNYKVDGIATNAFKITYLTGSSYGSHPQFWVQVHGW